MIRIILPGKVVPKARPRFSSRGHVPVLIYYLHLFHYYNHNKQMSYQNHLDDIDKLNAEDRYKDSERQYFLETTHGIYPIGVYGYVAGFDSLEAALERLKGLVKTDCSQFRLVDKHRKVVVLPTQ